MMGMIDVFHITKDYGCQRGIFDVSFYVEEGEVFGFLGPNGAGKTTMIRHLMGFVRADMGECFINGKNCWDEASLIQKKLGYLPGELTLLEYMTAWDFLKFAAQMRGQKSMRRAEGLAERFELDVSQKIRRMSKGTKQKVGLVCAFMHNPDVLILDEPTSGLDPLMQGRFVELLLEEKDMGKTIFLSSHMLDEIEKTADRIGILREGRLAAVEDAAKLRSSYQKTYLLTFEHPAAANAFQKGVYACTRIDALHLSARVQGSVSEFLQAAGQAGASAIDVKTESLEELFMHYYGGTGQ